MKSCIDFIELWPSALADVHLLQFFFQHRLTKQGSKAVYVEGRLKPDLAHDGVFNGYVGVLNLVEQYPRVTCRVVFHLPDRVKLVAFGRLDTKFGVKSQHRGREVVVRANNFHWSLIGLSGYHRPILCCAGRFIRVGFVGSQKVLNVIHFVVIAK